MSKSLSAFPLLSFFLILWGNSAYVPSVRSIGFYCNDTAIRMPYHGDSIHVGMLFLSLIGGGAIIICVSENLIKNNSNSFEFKYYSKKFYSGMLYVLCFIEILKLLFCELRPHFFFTCQPDIDQEKCSNGLVTDFTCTGDGPRWLVDRDIYKSFPSGHAALSSYAFVYLSMYVHSQMCLAQSSLCVLWRRFVPVISLAWSIACCISRLLDHRHFWWDVVVGVAIGLIGGLIMVNISINRKISSQRKKNF